ncbi:MAG: aldose epimerase family protein [Steroidobacteraceae bacterium]
MTRARRFGILEDGRTVEAVKLGTQDGLQAEVLTYGAILHRLSLPVAGQRRNLVLSLDQLGDYERDRAFVGPVVGRFGNRIAQGRFSIDGRTHQLTRNENGNHLHGGALGFGKRLWELLDHSACTLTLGLRSPAGEEGYPGTLDVQLLLRVQEDSLDISLTAHTDAPTPVNLTYHPYFNLGGVATAHWLRIPASRYLPVGAGLIPTGTVQNVNGTPFDFRFSRPLAPPPVHAHPQLAWGGGYDHCWLLDAGADCHCELRSPVGDVTLSLHGSGPGLQFYNGQFLSQTHPTLGSGVVLEPQGLPDAPNHAAFPNSIVRPGETYRAQIQYRLRCS